MTSGTWLLSVRRATWAQRRSARDMLLGPRHHQQCLLTARESRNPPWPGGLLETCLNKLLQGLDPLVKQWDDLSAGLAA